MKIRNLMLPMMAFICAIGMAFSTSNSVQQEHDYVDLGNGNFMEIDELDCGIGSQICQAELGEDGPVYPVYDEETSENPKQSSSEDPFTVDPE